MGDQYRSSSELMYVAPSDAPPSRRPPPGTIGPIGWLRTNLFSNWLNGLLTIITVVALALFFYEFIRWSIQSATWGVVINNLQGLNLYRYPPDQIWRIEVIGGVMMFLSGIGLAIWGGASRAFFLTTVVVIIFMVIIPVFSQRLEEAPIRYLVAYDDLDQLAGSLFPDQPYGPVRFVGDEGQTVRLSIEPITDNEVVISDDLEYVGLMEATAGPTSSRIRWNALKSAIRSGDINNLQNYGLTLRLQLLNATGTVLKEVVSTPDNPNVSFEVELPDDGWYIANVVAASETTSWKQVGGIRLPVAFQGYAWVRIDGVDIYGTKTNDITRRTEIYGDIPAVACYNTTDNTACQAAESNFRYEGVRSFNDYIKLQISPFLVAVTIPVVVAILILFFGYWLGYLAAHSQTSANLKAVNRFAVIGWIAMFPISWYLLAGVSGASDVSPIVRLPEVPSNLWGGLVLTLLLTLFSVTISLPIGILLALGRRSGLPVIGTFSILFIELIRGAPLITILYFAKHIFPFFASGLREIDDVIRMLVGLTLFSAAYNAEIVRGGLQIIPKGQIEAAQALGLNPFFTNAFIILPQAIRAVIPAIMSQFVSLFKDTTLVSIIGLFELLGVVEQIVNGQARYRSTVREIYLYVGAIYFVIAFLMSIISRRLEETGSGAARR